MIVHTSERPIDTTVQPTRRLTAQELERMTQSLYERSVLEVKAEWKRRFSAELRQQFDRAKS